MQHQVQYRTTNHWVIIFAVEEADTRWEYLWNHSTTVQLWKCHNPETQPRAYIHIFPSRELMAEMPAVASDGEWATLAEVKNIAQMHAAHNIGISTRVMGSAQYIVSTEQH